MRARYSPVMSADKSQSTMPDYPIPPAIIRELNIAMKASARLTQAVQKSFLIPYQSYLRKVLS